MADVIHKYESRILLHSTEIQDICGEKLQNGFAHYIFFEGHGDGNTSVTSDIRLTELY